MRIAAFAVIAAGLLLTVGGAFAPSSFDFAVALRNGWHVTVFPSPLIGGLVIAIGIGALLASFVWR
jgi:hypothetical protein